MQNAAAELELELAPGERLLWSTKPQQGIRFIAADAFLLPFALVWLAFSLGFELMSFRIPVATGGAMRMVFAIFGLPFVFIGLYLLAGRFFLDAKRRRNTAYGITNQRVLTVTRGRNRRIRSLDLAQIKDVETIERRDGSGRILLQSAGAPNYVMVGRNQPYPVAAGFSLDFVPNIREAAELLQQARSAAAKRL